MPGRLFVLLPVYNEGQSIYRLLAGFAQVLARLDLESRVLVVDDASADDSPRWIARAAQEFPGLNLEIQRHPVNQGLTGALNTGLERLGDLGPRDYLVTMDGDNTHSPFLIPEMLAKAEQGADLVIASRYCQQSRISGLSPLRVWLSRGAGLLYRLRWGIPGVRDYTCLFRLYAGPVATRFLSEGSRPYLVQPGFACSAELLAKMARHASVCVEVPLILRYANKVGASNMRLMQTIGSTLRFLLGRPPAGGPGGGA